MLELCIMLSSPYYAENYAGIIDTSLMAIKTFSFYIWMGKVWIQKKNVWLCETDINYNKRLC